MKRHRGIITIACILLALSGVLYYVHYLIFRDAHHIYLYLLGDIAFLPVEVFLVVMVLERALTIREKNTMLNKMNMVVGAFFSEMGTRLLEDLLHSHPDQATIRAGMGIKASWTTRDFKNALDFVKRMKHEVRCQPKDLEAMKSFLVGKRPFMLGLLENPNLLEHERFTDLLWALFHLTEELECRVSFDNLPPQDVAHLAGDIERVYSSLSSEWLDYVRHLKAQYPYLYSLVLRTHPFQERPSPIVK